MTRETTNRKLEAPVYSQAGKKVGTQTLPESVFAVPWKPDLAHEVVTSMRSNARSNSAHTKDRSEVRGGGRKPWRQKGTGRARHGSIRSPIWTGGGVTFGPRNERNYTRKINKNVRARALASVLSKKWADNEVVFVDTLSFEKPKAKEARAFVDALSHIEGIQGIEKKRKNAALLVLTERDDNTELSFRNFGNMTVVHVKDVNSVDLLTYKYVIVAKPKDALKILETRVSTKTARKALVVKK